jgi:hypothetical protein
MFSCTIDIPYRAAALPCGKRLSPRCEPEPITCAPAIIPFFTWYTVGQKLWGTAAAIDGHEKNSSSCLGRKTQRALSALYSQQADAAHNRKLCAVFMLRLDPQQTVGPVGLPS